MQEILETGLTLIKLSIGSYLIVAFYLITKGNEDKEKGLDMLNQAVSLILTTISAIALAIIKVLGVALSSLANLGGDILNNKTK